VGERDEMIKKPCYELFDDDENPEKCLENSNKQELCLHLENGGNWKDCKSGELNEFYRTSKQAEKEKLKTAQKLMDEILEYIDGCGVVACEDLKNANDVKRELLEIIKRNW
jgi:hypothetical protein